MKYLYNNQSGFSLVQAMVIASVVAGSGLVATRLITDQKLALKGAETRDQIEDLHQIAYSTLQNRDNCKATFEGTGVSANITNATGVTSFALPEIRSSNGTASILKVHGGDANNTYLNGNILVKSMDVTYMPATGKADLTIVYERLNSTDATKKTKSGFGGKDIRKTMVLRVQRNPFIAGPNKPFESCYSVTSSKVANNSLEQGNDINKDLCLQMNGNILATGVTGVSVFVWDEASSSCLPNAKCPANMVYTGIESTGQVLCKSMADIVDMNTLITPTTDTCEPGKRVFFEASPDGKTVKIRCEGASVDCSTHASPFNEAGGCVENVVVANTWYDVDAQCECRNLKGDFWALCNSGSFGGPAFATECRAK